MIKYLFPFLTAFSLTAVLIFLGISLGKMIKWSGRVSGRHIHRAGALRIGGAAMIIAFNLAIFLNKDLVVTLPLFGVMLASLILLVAGILDDWREMSWKKQLLFQLAAAITVFVCGVRLYFITNPFNGGIIKLDSGIGLLFSAMVVLVWMAVIMNAMNWLDGIDGLSGGVTTIAALAIFFLSLKPEVNQPAVAIISAIFAGTILAFIIFS